MSNPRLPAELLDHIVDFLDDDKYALRNCCLLSKSWISRTRRLLFVCVKLNTKEHLESWKEMFPDPSKSPGRYTRILAIDPTWINVADVEAGGWIRAFSRVVNLGLMTSNETRAPQQLPIFDLILLFPLLEGLTAAVDRTQADDNDGPDGLPTITLPSTPPMTGSLNLYKVTEMKPFALLLLSIPGGFHFRELNLTLTREDDLSSVTALVEGCSQTLKHLDITSNWPGEPGSGLIDLSKATRLETVTFQVGSYYVGWATKALRTIATEHRDLRQIAILIPSDIACVRVGTDIERTLGKTIYRWWSDLDRLLVEFWKSRSIRPRLGPARMWEIKEDMEFCIGDLLLDVIERRIFDLV